MNPDKALALAVVYDQPEHKNVAKEFAEAGGYGVAKPLDQALSNRSELYFLHFSDQGAYISWFDKPKKPVTLNVDFVEGANAHRRLYGGGKGQSIAKAVGVQAKFKPTILDATAGQGGDAFVFASLGCEVTLVERSPIAHLLLRSALDRGLACSYDDVDELQQTLQKMDLYFANSLEGLSAKNEKPWVMHDVVYLDPMFPERKKSAAVKKEMRIFHDLIGPDHDSDKLLGIVRQFARYRVVVKRPKGAPYLANCEPTYQLIGKSTRFDIYVNKALPSL